ncbi:MAG: FkbM family methyltransferase [Chitinophagales bacterium]
MAKLINNTNNFYELFEDKHFIKAKFEARKSIVYPGINANVLKLIAKKNYNPKSITAQLIKSFINSQTYIKSAEFLYTKLADSYSKEKLIELVCYRLLTPSHFKLSIENDDYLSVHRNVEKCIIDKDVYKIDFNNWNLSLFKLNSIGYNINIIYYLMGVTTTFGIEQYKYKPQNISVNKNDVVLDCGGCWGDTALYFSSIADNVKVYSFEFIHENIKLFEKNLTLNKGCDITIVQQPLWEDSNTYFKIVNNGPASTISIDNSKDSIQSICIDDFVKNADLQKIDYIKMDIEGAEEKALKGAIETIIKYKPTLAISVYHKDDDFEKLTKLIDDLDLGYKFYLDYYTAIGMEIVLFCRC